ncbi:DUF2232 domain-containing protein [Bacillus sp. SL00103]
MTAPVLIAVGLGMGVFYSRRQPGNAIIAGALIYLFGFSYLLYCQCSAFQIDIMNIAKESIEQMMPMVESTLKQSGASEKEIAKQLKQFKELQDTALNATCSALITATLMAFVNHWFVRPLIKRFVSEHASP